MLIKLVSKMNDRGVEVFAFGKYLDKSVNYILKINPEYIKWVKENTNKLFSIEFEQELKRLKLC